jgi:hypothetical protein
MPPIVATKSPHTPQISNLRRKIARIAFSFIIAHYPAKENTQFFINIEEFPINDDVFGKK